MREGFFYSQLLRDQGYSIAIAWEAAVFSLALGARYNRLKQETLRVQSENLGLLSQQNELLETRVRERTEEIRATNEELLLQQEEIKMQRDQLEAQNRLLEVKQQEISRHNEKLEEAVATRTKALVLQSEELMRQFKQLEQFNFITAHNLRGPVARILGLCNVLSLQQGTANQSDLLAKINSTAAQLDEVIRGLGSILEIKKHADESWVQLEAEPYIRSVIQRLQFELAEAKGVVSVNCDEFTLNGIQSFLDSIIFNLVANAIKYRYEPEPLHIDITLCRQQSMQILTVKDNGLGLDVEQFKEKLFQPFQRFHPAIPGKGLGLFLVYSQVQAMGGQVSVKGAPMKGIEFTIQLPVSAPVPASAS